MSTTTAAKAPPITHVLMITDASGSMSPLAEDVRGGFNGYIKDLATKDGNYRLTVTTFNTETKTLVCDAPLADVPDLTPRNYRPMGNTALLDAVGATLDEFDSRVERLRKKDKVLVFIQTDGEENSSRRFTRARVKSMISGREATGKWVFIFAGSGAEAWSEAGRLGIMDSHIIRSAGTRESLGGTYAVLSNATTDYAAGASGNQVTRKIADAPGVSAP